MELDLTAGGPAFAVKGQRDTFEDVHATETLRPQRGALAGAGWSDEWAVPELLVGYRRLARGRRRLRWTRRDAAAFGAAALWTYVSLPFLLAAGKLEVRLDGIRHVRHERWDR